jgi:hypothetical protein
MKTRLLKKSRKRIEIYKRGSAYYAKHIDCDWTTFVGDKEGAYRYYRIWVIRYAKRILGQKWMEKNRVI